MSKEILRATDVFGITRDLPLNYVTRPSVDDELVAALSRDQHLVIYGSSKQGKTSVRKYHLRDDEYIVATCSNRWNLGQLNSTILKQAGYTVVQTETRAASGHYKIQASAKLSAKLFGKGIEGQAGGEGGRQTTNQVTTAPLELDPFDVNDVIWALKEIGFDKWIVLEDFHYLPEETQKDFAVALKAFHESSSFTFIIVGVWLQENRLVQFNGDLSGRITTINADKWLRPELEEAIDLGEEKLGIKFDAAFRDTLLSSCYDSIYVVQESCLQACTKSGVHETQIPARSVAVGASANSIIKEVVDKQSARFSDFLTNFAAGFGQTDLEMYRWLLVPLIGASTEMLESGLPYRNIRRILSRVHPRGSSLNAGNVTQALKGVASLQVQQGVKPLVLDYDQSLKRLNIVDRSFLIWLVQQDKEDLVDMIDVPTEVLQSLESEEEEE
ncbi:hypothetical protein GTY75_11960 [Streptomyces sp. SID8381]|uniref:hypothetical protein n=1 Tax=unclassified Streptomyces TaxID=2593676 RepID=UPI0005691894|nr:MULTISPECIES: hypothetical protein [unclassified Streptomyces]MYX27357.1 hypothetical protein [Streptomyces sp. SID8381]